jgi:hypothetical protein
MFERLSHTLLAACCSLLFVLPFATAENLQADRSQSVLSSPPERFFVVLLSHQSADNVIKWSHTFATFIRASGASPNMRIIETRTISWLPAAGIVSLAHPAEPGVNKSLAESVAWAEAHGLQVIVNGPFEIRPELYRRAWEQAARLERGELRYKANDRLGRDKAKSCSHAIADIVEDHGRLDTGITRGQDATELVVRHFEPFFVSTGATGESSQLLQSLNLARFVKPQTNIVARSEIAHGNQMAASR